MPHSPDLAARIHIEQYFRKVMPEALGDVCLADVARPAEIPAEGFESYRLAPILPPYGWARKGDEEVGDYNVLPRWVTVEKYMYLSEGRYVISPRFYLEGHGGIGLTHRQGKTGRHLLLAVAGVAASKLWPDGQPYVLEIVQMQGMVRDEPQPGPMAALRALKWDRLLTRVVESVARRTGVLEVQIQTTCEEADSEVKTRITTRMKRIARLEGYTPDRMTGKQFKLLDQERR